MNSGDWFSKLAYSREGFCVAALDSRSQGGRSRNQGSVQETTWKGHIMRGLDDPDPRKLFFRQLFIDTAQLARVVMSFDEVDAGRVGAMGASQGGALACAALEPRIKRCVALSPFLCDFYTLLSTGSAFSELNHFLRLFDPLNERVEALFTRLGYIDCLHLAPRIKAQVLMYVGLTDTLCPPSANLPRTTKSPHQKKSSSIPTTDTKISPASPTKRFASCGGYKLRPPRPVAHLANSGLPRATHSASFAALDRENVR